jgi:hypothetical protein
MYAYYHTTRVKIVNLDLPSFVPDQRFNADCTSIFSDPKPPEAMRKSGESRARATGHRMEKTVSFCA